MTSIKQWRGPGVVVIADEQLKTLRISDSYVVLNAVGIVFALSSLWPFVVVRLRPTYHVTITGYGVTLLLGLFAILCFWINLRHSTNDVTLDLAKQTLDCRSGFFRRRRVVKLSDVRFRMENTSFEILGQRTTGVAVRVEGPNVSATILRFTPECADIVRSFAGVLAAATERPPEETLRRVASHASDLPDHMLVELLGLLAVVFGVALYMMLKYLVQASP